MKNNIVVLLLFLLIAANTLFATTITSGHYRIGSYTASLSITGDDGSMFTSQALYDALAGALPWVQEQICYRCEPGSSISVSFGGALSADDNRQQYTGPLGTGDLGPMWFSFISPEFVLQDGVLDYRVPFSATIHGTMMNRPSYVPGPIDDIRWDYSYNGTGVAAVTMRQYMLPEFDAMTFVYADFAFGDSAVPEPGTAQLLFVGLAG